MDKSRPQQASQKKHDPTIPTPYISEAGQVTRKIKSGPSTASPLIQTAAGPGPYGGSKSKKESDYLMGTHITDDEKHESELKVLESLKRGTVKENIQIEGKLSIVSKISCLCKETNKLSKLGRSNEEILTREGEREALCCKYNEEFDYVAVGYSDGVIKMFQSTTGEHMFTLADPDVKENRAPVTSVKHRPVSKIYPITNCYTGTYANGYVKCWSYNFNQCLYTIREKRQTFGITYHPRFPKFVTYGDDLKVLFYDEETKTQERVLCASDNQNIHDGHMSRVFAACFHPKNNYELLTGGWDDVVQFWDLRQPHAIRHLSKIHMCGEGIDINQKGTEVLCCAWQRHDPIQVFDYGSGKRLYCLEPDIYNSKLYCGRYASKDFIVCAGTDPNLLRIVDLQTTATSAFISGLSSAVYGLDLGPPKMKKESNKQEKYVVKNDITLCPKIAFVSAKKVYQIDFL